MHHESGREGSRAEEPPHSYQQSSRRALGGRTTGKWGAQAMGANSARSGVPESWEPTTHPAFCRKGKGRKGLAQGQPADPL